MGLKTAWIFRGTGIIQRCYLVEINSGDILRSCSYERDSPRAGEDNADRMGRLEDDLAREYGEAYEIDNEYEEPVPHEFKRKQGEKFLRY